MRDLIQELRAFLRRCDMVLVLLCLATSAFGCLLLASVTNAPKFGNSTRYLVVQILATLIGLILYFAMSAFDLDFLSEHRVGLMGFNLFLLLLLIPFGTDNNTGNRSWLHFAFLPFNIQPAEFCKIFYIVTMASVMSSHQSRLSNYKSVFHMCIYLGVLCAANMLISKDLGVTLIFVFIFVGMAYSGGVNLMWFGLAIGMVIVGAPIIWPYLSPHQQQRLEYLVNPSIDPNAQGVGWHTSESLKSLTGGGLTGQGLFNGNRTQAGALYAQHTDYVFSSIGEELGFLGCALVVISLVAIIVRCIWVGAHTPDYMRRVVCFGAASAMIFQVISNVGMCIGITPVIGLTLPLYSYGGSSIVATYMMLGLVSGVHARPAPRSHERYIQPPR